MSKQVIEYTGKRIIYETALPAPEVAKRLDTLTGVPAAGTPLMRYFDGVKNRADVEKAIENITGGKDFMQFNLIKHHDWVRPYLESKDIPEIFLYSIGNPLIAQTMLKYDLVVGLHVPPRVVVVGNTDGRGSRVIYDQPSSLITATKPGGSHADELKKAAEVLDAKFERLIKSAVEV